MSYTKRVWENTGEEVTYEDFNRIEQGIESNDLEISKQKDATKEGSLAKQIADIKDETQEGSLAQKIADAEEQINVLNTIDSTLVPTLVGGFTRYATIGDLKYIVLGKYVEFTFLLSPPSVMPSDNVVAVLPKSINGRKPIFGYTNTGIIFPIAISENKLVLESFSAQSVLGSDWIMLGGNYICQ